ncbi:MAG: 30S ribosomal protein S4 [Candidatus Woesearchaeota archaeon]
MGDPKKLRKKYSGPSHPWKKARIDSEAILVKEYGLRNKKEIWRLESKIKNFKDQVKNLSAKKTNQAEIEKNNLLKRLRSIKILSETSTLEDTLSLTVKDLMERRLQTLVFRKGLANSIKQARQFIVHRHVSIGDKKISVPSYIVHVDEEPLIRFSDNSALKDEDHPERKKPEVEKVPGLKKEKPMKDMKNRRPGQKKEFKHDKFKRPQKKQPNKEKPRKDRKE